VGLEPQWSSPNVSARLRPNFRRRTLFPPERDNSRFSKPLDAVLARSHKIPFGNFEFLLARTTKGCYRPCVTRDSTVERGAPDLFKRAGLNPGSFYFQVLINNSSFINGNIVHRDRAKKKNRPQCCGKSCDVSGSTTSGSKHHVKYCAFPNAAGISTNWGDFNISRKPFRGNFRYAKLHL
jgi:hypothetical protein